eukprot:gene5277-7054_t
MSRPEYTAPPEIIQRELTERCLELLNLPDGSPSLILDVGCGSGLSGEAISNKGHFWIGFDISHDMLGEGYCNAIESEFKFHLIKVNRNNFYVFLKPPYGNEKPVIVEVAEERDCEGDLLLQDMGHGVPFQPGTFDGVISVSALQWICNQDKSSHNPVKRMKRFFTTLYSSMAHGARAVFQFYPDGPEQMQLITQQAMKCGFTGGIVIDYPNSTRAKKIFLCLFAGVVGNVPKGKADVSESTNQTSAAFTRADRRQQARRNKRTSVKSKDWIIKKKESRRKKLGQDSVKSDSKYTGRKRPTKF